MDFRIASWAESLVIFSRGSALLFYTFFNEVSNNELGGSVMYYYCSWYDWTIWHDTRRRKALVKQERKKDWNKKTKLPRIVQTRKGCWL